MSLSRKIGLGLLVVAFVGAKIFVLFSRKTSGAVALLGVVILILSSPQGVSVR